MREGVPWQRPPPAQRPPFWTETPLDRAPLDRDPPPGQRAPPPRQRPPTWTETPLDREPLEQRPSLHRDPPCTETLPAQRPSLHRDPPCTETLPAQRPYLHRDPPSTELSRQTSCTVRPPCLVMNGRYAYNWEASFLSLFERNILQRRRGGWSSQSLLVSLDSS